ncbi:MAG: nucleotidyltransferase family protein [bacterium]|nr:nucleotidyltransferase family protein [bacterium]
MQAVILAAGIGKRMRPVTLTRPKPLIEVAGTPLIEHVIEALPSIVDELIIIVGYKGAMIRTHLGPRHGSRAIRYVEQANPEGTAAALALARPFLSGRFLLMCADDIHGAPALAAAMRYPLAILAAFHAEPQKFGVIEMSAAGTLLSFEEKPDVPKSDLVSTGAMVLDERVFAYPAPHHDNGEYYLTSQVAALAEDAPVHVVRQDMWIPVGCPEDIPVAERLLQQALP